MAHAFGDTRRSIAEAPIRFRWPLLLFIVTCLVAGLLLAFVLFTTANHSPQSILVGGVALLRDGLQFSLDEIVTFWEAFLFWSQDHYHRVPTLMLGLAALAILPVLALLSSVFGAFCAPTWDPDATRRLKRNRGVAEPTSGSRTDFERAAQQPPWPMQAWLEVDGASQSFSVGSDIVQIGRDVDTDVRLSDPTVHRYHATIHRSEDGPYIITDLAAPYGNGVFVNGGRVTAAVLRSGDQIHVGKRPLKFMARPM